MSPVVPFTLEMPRAIHFGSGSLDRLPALARTLGRRLLLFTGGRSFDDSPRLRDLAALEGCTVHRIRCDGGEPTERLVDEAGAAAADLRPDLIVAVGGGSVIDTAKAVSALAAHPGPCRRFLEGVDGAVPVPGPGVPWLAVPTTAGTGAEVTKNAVVLSDSAGAKRSMRSAHLLAQAVFVDPLLTVSLPAAVTGASGLDALTQLIEAYVTRAGNPFVSSVVEGAFPGMLEALEGLTGAPTDITLRTKASYGALASGVALANAGLGAAHGFAAAVGTCRVPHGLACAVFMPHVLAVNAPLIGDRIAALARCCGGPRAGEDAVTWLSSKICAILAAYGLPRDLRGYEIPRSRIPELAVKAMGSSMRGNPRELSLAQRTEILEAVLLGTPA